MYFSIAYSAALRLRTALRPLGMLAALMLIGSGRLTAAEIELAWNANPDEDNVAGYRLHYGITSGHYEATKDVGSAHSAVLKNLANSTRYFVAVTAYNRNGLESEPSEEFDFITSTSASGSSGNANSSAESEHNENELDTEGDLPAGNLSAQLSWDANPDEDQVAGYRLYYGTVSGSYPAMLDVGNSTTAAITGLAENTIYFVVLTAYNDQGIESPPSEEFQFVAQNNLPPEIVLTRIGGDNTSTATDEMILLAAARDEDGFISRVDFYDGSRLLHSDENFPYALRVSSLANGLHQFRAVAVDDLGETTESNSLNIQVGALISPPDSETLTLTLAPPISGKTPLFSVTAPPGSRVQLHASEDLSRWDMVSESVADEFGNVAITDPTPDDELPNKRFYRVAIP